ncbi:SGNH/GDSL hydrolase family protein [Gordonia hirsuta]|nr:SGNH/GDSL hydrolase family protein [Gordonia hirsuta]
MRRVGLAFSAAISALLLVVSIGPPAAAMPDPAPRGAEYVSLGDSFVAVGSLSTATARACSQAPDNVGRLVAARIPGVGFGDWACGGADTADLTTVTDRGPQVRGLGPDTRFVSISIGGNDESLFLELMRNCLIGITCTPAVRAQAQAKVNRLGTKLDNAYAAVRKAAPNAHVVVLGYLMIAPRNPAGCFLEASAGRQNAVFARGIQEQLNRQIARAAARVGFTMLNEKQPDGHTMCGADGQRWVALTGVLPGENGIPVHPTLAGRQYTAKLIADAFMRG